MMITFFRYLTAAVFVAVTSLRSIAFATDTLTLDQEVGEVKGWHIFKSDIRQGCIAADNYDNNTVFIWGLNNGVESAFVAVANESWAWIEIGKTYSAAFVFDEKETWSLFATGVRRTKNNEPTLLFDNTDINLLQKIADAGRVKIVIGNRVLVGFVLDGTRSALADLMVCSFNSKNGQDVAQKGKSYSASPGINETTSAETESIESTETDSNERLSYGSRAGMDVMVLSKSGIDTASASITIQLTRENAAEFCEFYLGDTSSRCIDKVIKEDGSRLRPAVTGNCMSKTWTDMYGNSYVFKGKNSNPQGDVDAEYIVQDIKTGDVLDASSASGYAVTLGVFRALCPGSL